MQKAGHKIQALAPKFQIPRTGLRFKSFRIFSSGEIMRRVDKSTNGAANSNNAPHKNQPSDAAQKGSITAELTAGEVTQDEKHQLIAEAAYYRAEQRNFIPGCELSDWLDAEAEIETMIVPRR
jgi:hypothetical protein